MSVTSMKGGKVALPTFVRAADGRWYEDLVYQDHPLRRAWFVCFDPDEPAEIVVRADYLANMAARDILRHRGFDKCLRAIVNGRKDPHKRFFGPQEGQTPVGFDAVSWFLVFRSGVPLPTPSEHDSCVEIWPVFPNRPGAYFGDKQ